MDLQELQAMFEKQMALISDESKKSGSNLPALSHAMCQTYCKLKQIANEEDKEVDVRSRKLLEEQLRLLSNRSEQSRLELPALTDAMSTICFTLYHRLNQKMSFNP